MPFSHPAAFMKPCLAGVTDNDAEPLNTTDKGANGAQTIRKQTGPVAG